MISTSSFYQYYLKLYCETFCTVQTFSRVSQYSHALPCLCPQHKRVNSTESIRAFKSFPFTSLQREFHRNIPIPDTQSFQLFPHVSSDVAVKRRISLLCSIQQPYDYDSQLCLRLSGHFTAGRCQGISTTVNLRPFWDKNRSNRKQLSTDSCIRWVGGTGGTRRSGRNF